MIEITLPSASAAIVLLVATLVLIAGLFWLFLYARRTLRRQSHDPRDRRFIANEWAQIQQLSQGDSHALEIAVVRADKLLDHLLKTMVMPGSTLGERLKVACARYPELKDVWWAHKVRNDIVHETHGHSPRKLQQAIKEFERAFKKLGAL